MKSSKYSKSKRKNQKKKKPAILKKTKKGKEIKSILNL